MSCNPSRQQSRSLDWKRKDTGKGKKESFNYMDDSVGRSKLKEKANPV